MGAYRCIPNPDPNPNPDPKPNQNTHPNPNPDPKPNYPNPNPGPYPNWIFKIHISQVPLLNKIRPLRKPWPFLVATLP